MRGARFARHHQWSPGTTLLVAASFWVVVLYVLMIALQEPRLRSFGMQQPYFACPSGPIACTLFLELETYLCK